MRRVIAVIGVVALAVAVGYGVAVMLVTNEVDRRDPATILDTTVTIEPAGIRPYDSRDVSDAFESAGIPVTLSRTDARGCPTRPSWPQPEPPLRGMRRGEWASFCLRYTYKNGKLVRDKRKVVPERPRLLGWTDDRTSWVIYVYVGTDDAAQVTKGKDSLAKMGVVRGQLVRFERAENVVVMFARAVDAPRVRDVLDRL